MRHLTTIPTTDAEAEAVLQDTPTTEAGLALVLLYHSFRQSLSVTEALQRTIEKSLELSGYVCSNCQDDEHQFCMFKHCSCCHGERLGGPPQSGGIR